MQKAEQCQESGGELEIEAKVLGIDFKELETMLRSLGAQLEGVFELTEQRFGDAGQSVDSRPSIRLRKKTDITPGRISHAIVKLVRKEKLPSVVVAGVPRFKCRQEHPLPVLDGQNGDTYEINKAALLRRDLLPSHAMVTRRTTYVLDDVRCEMDEVLQCNGQNVVVPPFLEIEGPNPDAIIAAARRLGFSVEDLSPLSKKAVVKMYAPDALGEI